MSGNSQELLPEKLIIALGGNAIHPAGIKGTGEEQFDIAAKAAKALLPVLRDIPELVFTHGNGPGVGKVLMRQAIASKRVATMPLDICVANSQGGISYVIMQTMQNCLNTAKVDRVVSSILCEVEVDATYCRKGEGKHHDPTDSARYHKHGADEGGKAAANADGNHIDAAVKRAISFFAEDGPSKFPTELATRLHNPVAKERDVDPNLIDLSNKKKIKPVTLKQLPNSLKTSSKK